MPLSFYGYEIGFYVAIIQTRPARILRPFSAWPKNHHNFFLGHKQVHKFLISQLKTSFTLTIYLKVSLGLCWSYRERYFAAGSHIYVVVIDWRSHVFWFLGGKWQGKHDVTSSTIVSRLDFPTETSTEERQEKRSSDSCQLSIQSFLIPYVNYGDGGWRRQTHCESQPKMRGWNTSRPSLGDGHIKSYFVTVKW